MPRLSELLVADAQQTQETQALIAKAANLTHTLAKMNVSSLDAVMEMMDRQTAVSKAMDTTGTGTGAEWIVAGFSPDIIQAAYLERKVSSLFQRLRMPTNPYIWPVQGGFSTAYITPQQTADSGQTSVAFSDPATRQLELTAVKLSVATHLSDEFEQDSIADVRKFVNQQILLGLVSGEEDAIINGDTAVSHMDSDVTASNDRRKAFDGLRKKVNAAAKVDASGATSLLKAIRSARAAMGVYGADPNKLAVITSSAGHIQLLNEGAVLTQDKFGPQATVLTGELGKIDGMPLIVSQFVRADLNASGVFDNTTKTQTEILLVYTGAFVLGDRLDVQLESERFAIYGQDSLIGRERIAFDTWYDASTQNMVGEVYNVPTS